MLYTTHKTIDFGQTSWKCISKSSNKSLSLSPLGCSYRNTKLKLPWFEAFQSYSTLGLCLLLQHQDFLRHLQH